MKKLTVGVLAHVDAGKTTLSESILFLTGTIKSAGRVDHGDTSLDTHALERERGITIFSKQAVFSYGGTRFTLVDTPGHADFAAEMERTLSVLDGAVLVISGTAGVQAHTETLWRLLEHAGIPCFLFVSKMDLATADRDRVFKEISDRLSPRCADFTHGIDAEELALRDEGLFETYMESGTLSDGDIAGAVAVRRVFPVCFGSGLKGEGVETLLACLDRYGPVRDYPSRFGARVFKIARDPQGNRLTFVKLTGGELRVREPVAYVSPDGTPLSEKLSQIREYSGAKFETPERCAAGSVCALLGLSQTYAGQGLGFEQDAPPPELTPALSYRIRLPQGVDAREALPRLKLLQEEDPQLGIVWNQRLQEIQAQLMGETQIQVLKSLIAQRFDMEVQVDQGRVLYRETIAEPVEGAGHFEPLRHYAEVHLLLEPLKRGSGLQFSTRCGEDVLDRNWQRLILTHLEEKQHLGVLTGSPITDMRITLTAGRAHLKHTEGGDFRQATYRAVRQGLMKAKSVLLEPIYAFRLEVPLAQTGRAVNDIRAMNGDFRCESRGEESLLEGSAPVAAMSGYLSQVMAYTGGRGRLSLRLAGYQPCRDQDKIAAELGYDPESDTENTADSVFCAHGAGFHVKWSEADGYMHLDSGLGRAPEEAPAPRLRPYNLDIDEKELEAIMVREFGPIKRPQYRSAAAPAAAGGTETAAPRREYLIVDGYNVIFAWDELKALAGEDLAQARAKLMDILASYRSFTGSRLVLVFDGYNVPGNQGEKFTRHGVNVVYTRQNETGDMYIEKLAHDIGRNFSVRVVTSDNLIRLSALRSGVLRTSAREFVNEVEWVYRQIGEVLSKTREKEHTQKIVFGEQKDGT
ncbi:MAG: NYN domain-containing protein [Oscillospiraceae bacterium]